MLVRRRKKNLSAYAMEIASADITAVFAKNGPLPSTLISHHLLDGKETLFIYLFIFVLRIK